MKNRTYTVNIYDSDKKLVKVLVVKDISKDNLKNKIAEIGNVEELSVNISAA